jgi:non-ribosomal peptide synthetase component F
VQSLFKRQVLHFAQSSRGVRPDGDCWSYVRLNSLANRVANLLLARGLKPEQPVGVYMQRSPETVGVLLGILKAGGVYVPLDLNLPIERLRYIASDAMFRYLFVDAERANKVSDAALNGIDLLSCELSTVTHKK